MPGHPRFSHVVLVVRFVAGDYSDKRMDGKEQNLPKGDGDAFDAWLAGRAPDEDDGRLLAEGDVLSEDRGLQGQTLDNRDGLKDGCLFVAKAA